MAWLLSIYIAATVFGVGVTAIDLFGLIGDQESDGEDGDDGGADDGDADFDGDGADFDGDAGGDFVADGVDADLDGGGDFDTDADGDADFDADSDGDDGGDAEGDGDATGRASVAGHDRKRRNPVLRILSALRNLVYFALGFGPTGWFALGTGESIGAALAWSGGVGVTVLIGARVLRRILRSELSSEVKASDLLMEKGTVTVTIGPDQMGKVRIRLGGALVDRYARSKLDRPLPPGSRIQVTDIDEDCVYVEPEEE